MNLVDEIKRILRNWLALHPYDGWIAIEIALSELEGERRKR